MVEVDEIKRNMERELGCFFVEVTLPEAAKLIGINKVCVDDQRQAVSADTTRAMALFERPNPGQTRADLLEAAFAQLTGEVRNAVHIFIIDDNSPEGQSFPR